MADMKNALASGDEFGLSQAIMDWHITLHFRHEEDYVKNAGRAPREDDPSHDLIEFLAQLD
jgi:hypothetical protein